MNILSNKLEKTLKRTGWMRQQIPIEAGRPRNSWLAKAAAAAARIHRRQLLCPLMSVDYD